MEPPGDEALKFDKHESLSMLSFSLEDFLSALAQQRKGRRKRKKKPQSGIAPAALA